MGGWLKLIQTRPIFSRRGNSHSVASGDGKGVDHRKWKRMPPHVSFRSFKKGLRLGGLRKNMLVTKVYTKWESALDLHRWHTMPHNSPRHLVNRIADVQLISCHFLPFLVTTGREAPSELRVTREAVITQKASSRIPKSIFKPPQGLYPNWKHFT